MKKYTSLLKLFFTISVLYFSPLSYAADKPDFDLSIKTPRNNVTVHFMHEPLRPLSWRNPLSFMCSRRVGKGVAGVLTVLGTALIGYNYDSHMAERAALAALRGEYNTGLIKDREIIDRCDFQMINESSLHTDKRYNPASIEQNGRALRQRIIAADHLEESVQRLRDDVGFFRGVIFKIPEQATLLLKDVRKQNTHLQIHWNVNESLFQLQRGNYDGKTAGAEGAYHFVQKAGDYITEYRTQLSDRWKDLKKRREGEDKDLSEWLELKYHAERTINLQGIVQRRLGETAENKKDLAGWLNRSLYSYNVLLQAEKGKKDVRKANVLSNRGFLLYGWIGDLVRGQKSLDQGYVLDSHNPFIMMHQALCFKEFAQTNIALAETTDMKRAELEQIKIIMDLKEEKTKRFSEPPANHLDRAEFFSSEAVKLVGTNYLIRQVNGQIIYKRALAQPDINWFLRLFYKDPKQTKLERAQKEFGRVRQYLRDNTLEISTGFDAYYYYEKAQIYAALGLKDQADACLRKAQKYMEGVKKDGKQEDDPFNYVKDIIKGSLEKVQNPNIFRVGLKLPDIDGPIVVNGGTNQLLFVRNSDKTNSSELSKTDGKSTGAEPANYEEVDASIEALLKGMKEASDSTFGKEKYKYVLENNGSSASPHADEKVGMNSSSNPMMVSTE